MPSPPDTDHARGALLGLAVGDALGTTLEFARIDPPMGPWRRLEGPHREMRGGGPYEVLPGQVTDDTHMACCLAASLREHGRLEVADLAHRYHTWSQVTFDIGDTIARAVALLAVGVPNAGEQVWESGGRNLAANGALMRAAPIAVFFAEDPARRREVAMAEAALTHFDPRCQLANAAFTAAVATGVLGGSPADVHASAAAEVDRAATALAESRPDLADLATDARSALLADLQAAEAPDPDLYGAQVHLMRQMGFVRVAFRLAFFQLLHAPSYEDALIDVVNRGGDADTNGAIAGALLGAVFGESGIPDRWRDAVLGVSPPGPFGAEYHPRVLVATR